MKKINLQNLKIRYKQNHLYKQLDKNRLLVYLVKFIFRLLKFYFNFQNFTRFLKMIQSNNLKHFFYQQKFIFEYSQNNIL